MKMTWEECAAAGMTATEAARARGRSIGAASHYAKRCGLAFRDGRKDEANAERHAERLRAIHANPDADTRQHHIRAVDAAGLLADYRTLTRCGYKKAEALAALGVSA